MFLIKLTRHGKTSYLTESGDYSIDIEDARRFDDQGSAKKVLAEESLVIESARYKGDLSWRIAVVDLLKVPVGDLCQRKSTNS